MGNELTPIQVKDQPTVTWEAESDSYYTLIMSDPPLRETPTSREISHWYVVNIPGANIDKGDTIIGFIGSGPSKDTGLHRYVLLIFKQNGKLEYDEPYISNR